MVTKGNNYVFEVLNEKIQDCQKYIDECMGNIEMLHKQMGLFKKGNSGYSGITEDICYYQRQIEVEKEHIENLQDAINVLENQGF